MFTRWLPVDVPGEECQHGFDEIGGAGAEPHIIGAGNDTAVARRKMRRHVRAHLAQARCR